MVTLGEKLSLSPRVYTLRKGKRERGKVETGARKGDETKAGEKNCWGLFDLAICI